MKLLEPYLGLTKAIAIITAVIGLFGAGVKVGADHVQAKWNQKEAERIEATLQLERETRRAIDAITINSQREKDRAKTTIDSLRANLRTGAERLSVAVNSCTPGTAATGNSEARAELLPATAERVLDVGAEANDAVRDLNACIDKYNAVREGRLAE